jgi:zinc protease
MDAANAAIDRVAAQMRAGSISADEFERARKPVVEGLKSRFENNGFWLEAISQSQSRADWLEWTRTLRADFESITLDEVKGAAGGLFDPARALRVRVVAEGAVKAP